MYGSYCGDLILYLGFPHYISSYPLRIFWQRWLWRILTLIITVSSLGNILDFRAQYDFVVYGLGQGGIELLQLE